MKCLDAEFTHILIINMINTVILVSKVCKVGGNGKQEAGKKEGS